MLPSTLERVNVILPSPSSEADNKLAPESKEFAASEVLETVVAKSETKRRTLATLIITVSP
jgi:hypothetical protein